MSKKIIQVKNLSVELSGHTILEKLSFGVESGDFFVVIGPNGGGKTILVKTLLGLIKPSSGEIIIKEGLRIGYVPQFVLFDVNFPVSAFEVAMMGRQGHGSFLSGYKTNDKKKVSRALEDVGLAEEIYRHPFSDLSGGQKQRVLIARALVSDPEVIFLDEPTASIDPVSNEKVGQLFSKLNKKGVTIFMVTHDVGAVSQFITKIGCLNRKLFFHDSKELSTDMVQGAYGCYIDLVSHGVAHRILDKKKHHKDA